MTTFLFTDLEDSTPLWESFPDLMQGLVARHDELMREAIAAHRGRVVKSTGDGFHAVFDAATDAIRAAVAGQQSMLEQSWPADTGPLQVRMGLHTGESRELAEVRRLLGGTHLLTLLGPGGTGKTRLMLEAAEEVIDDYAATCRPRGSMHWRGRRIMKLCICGAVW